jgi:two-component SAPR family response regulator
MCEALPTPPTSSTPSAKLLMQLQLNAHRLVVVYRVPALDALDASTLAVRLCQCLPPYQTVDAAFTAVAALAHPEVRRIDLLISDVALPNGMNGRQVAEAARQVLPGLKVLFITGYAENAALRGVQLELGMQLMVKPFTMEALGSRINAMIGDD